jgi:hypothetical protein
MRDTNGVTHIENVENEKDLGVIFDKKLSFNEHIASKVKRANQALGIIKRTFTYMDKDIILPLYKTYIRPHLEYASVIWSPTYQKDIIAIEQVQRRATCLVPGLKHLSYEDRLRTLGLPTLMYRRERADILQVFKILHKYEEVNIKISLTLSQNRSTRGHTLKLDKVHQLSRFSQNRFSNRVINNWNSLDNSTVCATSVDSCKSQLNIHWKTRQSKFGFPYTCSAKLPSRANRTTQLQINSQNTRLALNESSGS